MAERRHCVLPTLEEVVENENPYPGFTDEQHKALHVAADSVREALEAGVEPGPILTEIDAVLWDGGWEITPNPSRESFRRRRGHA